MLWTVLHNCHDDWRNFSRSYPIPSDKEEDVRRELLSEALVHLQPRFIQCLFSYVNFFFLMDTGFGRLSKEVSDLYRKLQLKPKALKKPKPCSYIEKLRLVRNKTIVHWGEPKNAECESPDDRAGWSWDRFLLTNDEDLYDFIFGGSSVPGALDRQLLPFRETHRICTEYLWKYDEHCASLLVGLKPHLPKTVDGVRYEIVDPFKKRRSRSE